MRRTRLSVAAALAVATSAAVVAVPAVATAAPGDIPVQLVAMNDFHGRIAPMDPTSADSKLTTPGADGAYGTGDDTVEIVGGSAYVASAVRGLQSSFANPANSFFVGAGDLISASPYESSVFKDEPTIEILNAMGLDVSSVGNHEFDRGTEELRRVSAATDDYETARGSLVTACEGVEADVDGCWTDSTSSPFEGTDFPYLAANVLDASGAPVLPPYQLLDIGGGKQMALIGVVTETLPTLVSPDGIAGLTITDEAEAVNTWVPRLQAMGVQAIGVLMHEGGTNGGADASNPSGCASVTGPIVDINNRIDDAVDLVVSAHTHQAYNCVMPVANGTPRLVTSAGYYGRLVTDIRLDVDPDTGDVDRGAAAYKAANVPVLRTNPAADIQQIVDYWAAKSAVAGNRVVGSATTDIRRAGSFNTAGQYVAVRDRESSLGNLVAEMQLQALQEEQYGFPEVAFMNPGGLRTDILAGDVTYKELFDVQPFGNTANAITMTGADIKQVLEEQFPKADRTTQLWLGTSEGFSYSYDPARPTGSKIDPCSITLDGKVLDPAGNYRVAVNNFLIAGGDGFSGFKNGTAGVTGPVDVDTSVEYFEGNSPVAPPAANHATQTTDFRCDATAAISKATPTRGEQVAVTGTAFAPSRLVTATLSNGRVLGTAAADASGAVSIAFRVPTDLPAGQQAVTLTSASGEKASTTFTLGMVASDVRTVVRTVVTKLLAWLFRR